MAKRLTLEEKIALIREIGENEITADKLLSLKNYLREKSNILVRKAAKVIEKREIRDFIPELQEAFARFMENPAKSDPNCLAKMAIIDTLYALDHTCLDLYISGSRHIQFEPVYGGRKDTADEMRGRCIQALVSFGFPYVMFEIARLLNDDCWLPRRAAANAASAVISVESELLLRMKIYAGDEESDVLGICFSGLINIAPERNIDFVASYLKDRDKNIAFLAALALGESHSEEAFIILEERYKLSFKIDEKKKLILPISLLRSEKAFDFLLTVIQDTASELSSEAVSAIEIYADSPARKARIDRILLKR